MLWISLCLAIRMSEAGDETRTSDIGDTRSRCTAARSLVEFTHDLEPMVPESAC